MALQAVCPSCHSSFTLPDDVAGKKVRCKVCQVIFSIKAPPPKIIEEVHELEAVEEVEAVEDVLEVEEAEEPEAPPRKKGSALKPTRPPVPERLDDLSPQARPRPKAAVQKTQPAGTPSVRKTAISGGDQVGDRVGRGGQSPTKSIKAGNAAAVVSGRDLQHRPNHVPLILGSVLVGLVVVVGGAVAVAYVLKTSPEQNNTAISAAPQVIYIPPAPPPPPPLAIPVLPAPQQGQSANPVAAGDPKPGKITKDSKEAVKHATVLIKVTMADGSKASGTGFFGCAESPNLILTNAHVVGMLSSDSLRPQKVDIVLNSGQGDDEDEGPAEVLGVDRSSDLAVLQLHPEGLKKSKPLPTPITVSTGEKLTELDDVYVFGFPLGEKLGKEITIRPSSVSSLRKISGTNILDKIQVNGGMDPGNSGGPVVDTSGSVVGVAVSGIQGRMINFAIPGERVHTILNGRISELGIGQPFVSGKQVGVPVTAVLLDPRNLVKDVSLEVWAGPAGPPRAASKQKPETKAGDTPRQRFHLAVNGRERKGEVTLPVLDDGMVYWIQPVFTDGAGETSWVSANVYKLPSQPVERKPADLVYRPRVNAPASRLVLTQSLNFKVGADEDSLVGKGETKVLFDSQVASFTQQTGAVVVLTYLDAKETRLVKVGDKGTADDFKEIPNETFKQIGTSYKKMRVNEQLDSTGTIIKTALDLPLGTSRQTADSLMAFHKPISMALNSVAISLPNRNAVQPNESWKAKRDFLLETPDKAYVASFDMTYTYLGQRRRGDRDEAVVAMAGDLRHMEGKNGKVASSISGTALVDVVTGEIIQAHTTLVMDDQISLKTPDGTLNLRARVSFDTRVEYTRAK